MAAEHTQPGKANNKGQQAVGPFVSYILTLLVIVSAVGGFFTYLYADHARTATIEAAYAAANTATMLCATSGSSSWQAGATAAAANTLRGADLPLHTSGIAGRPGTWSVTFQVGNPPCAPMSTITAIVHYNVLDLFPPIGQFLPGAVANGWGLSIQASSSIPVS